MRMTTSMCNNDYDNHNEHEDNYNSEDNNEDKIELEAEHKDVQEDGKNRAIRMSANIGYA